jgi:TetR/AcrR family transcriptional regulator
VPSALKSGKSGSRGEPEKTRAAILKAALEEFSNEGVAGARTDEIARRAGVNKDKEGLYAAALEQVFSGLHQKVAAVLERSDLPPRERLVLYAQTHFDYIASAPVYPRLVQREFMRSSGRTLSPAASQVMERHVRPFYERLEKLILEGARTGDFRRLDPMHTVTSLIGVIVFYFITIPAQQFFRPGDPVSPERIAARRAAMLDFICAAVLTPEAAKKVCQP